MNQVAKSAPIAPTQNTETRPNQVAKAPARSALIGITPQTKHPIIGITPQTKNRIVAFIRPIIGCLVVSSAELALAMCSLGSMIGKPL